MGIRALWPFVEDKSPPTKIKFSEVGEYCKKQQVFVNIVDVSFFKLKKLLLNHDDKEKKIENLKEFIIDYFFKKMRLDPKGTTFVFDGELTGAKKSKKIERIMPSILKKKLKKMKIEKNIKKRQEKGLPVDRLVKRCTQMGEFFDFFVPGFFADILRGVRGIEAVGFNFVVAPGEADVEIARLSTKFPGSAVITKDGDHFAYSSIKKIIRPIKDNMAQVFLKKCVLRDLRLSDEQWSTLLCFCATDYAVNIPRIGLKTLFSIFTEVNPCSKIHEAVLDQPKVLAAIRKSGKAREFYYTEFLKNKEVFINLEEGERVRNLIPSLFEEAGALIQQTFSGRNRPADVDNAPRQRHWDGPKGVKQNPLLAKNSFFVLDHLEETNPNASEDFVESAEERQFSQKKTEGGKLSAAAMRRGHKPTKPKSEVAMEKNEMRENGMNVISLGQLQHAKSRAAPDQREYALKKIKSFVSGSKDLAEKMSVLMLKMIKKSLDIASSENDLFALIENGKTKWQTAIDHMIKALVEFPAPDRSHRTKAQDIDQLITECCQELQLQKICFPAGCSGGLKEFRNVFQTNVANHFSKYALFLEAKRGELETLLETKGDDLAGVYSDLKAVECGTSRFKPGYLRRFITANARVESPWSVVPDYLPNYFGMSEHSLAAILFSSMEKKELKRLKLQKSEFLDSCNVLFKNGKIIKFFIEAFEDDRDGRRKAFNSKVDKDHIIPTRIITDGYYFKILFMKKNKDIGLEYEPVDIEDLMKRPIEEKNLNSEWNSLQDGEKLRHILQSGKPVTFTGCDPGERYPLAYTSIRGKKKDNKYLLVANAHSVSNYAAKVY